MEKVHNGNIHLVLGDCIKALDDDYIVDTVRNKKIVIVTDPPFNVRYHYKGYKDNLPEDEYYEMLDAVFTKHHTPFVVIHYPEALYRIAYTTGIFPDRVVSWTYNSNTARQHRDIGFFGIAPDFTKVTQPYKNPNDKRIQALIAKGKKGSRLYDWWNINQVKNVSKKSINHPCVMPLIEIEPEYFELAQERIKTAHHMEMLEGMEK